MPDNILLRQIFTRAVHKIGMEYSINNSQLKILTADDLVIDDAGDVYDYYGYQEHEKSSVYDSIYQERINKMNSEKALEEAKVKLNKAT